MKKREKNDYGFKKPSFTKRMKKEYTILAPDIFPLHIELICRVFRLYGYKIEVLHSQDRIVIEKGLESLNNDICYPVVCMVGQQIDAIESGKYDKRKVALIQFQTGGGCRASNYIWMTRKALNKLGYGYIPVLSLSLNKMEKESGFKTPFPMLLKCFISILYGDMLSICRNQTYPYEENEGECEELLKKWYDKIEDDLLHNRNMIGHGLRKNLKDICRDFSAVKRKDIKKVKVGIVGEIYVQYSSLGNNHLQEFLEREGCEVCSPSVFSFFMYMFDNRIGSGDTYGTKRHVKTSKVGMHFALIVENFFLSILKDFPIFTPPLPYKEMKKCSDGVVDKNIIMGEGWLLSSEAGEMIQNGYKNIICVQPFGCLPNHIVGKGAIRKLREKYPDANICGLDFDSSESKVNIENRVRLMLEIGREKL